MSRNNSIGVLGGFGIIEAERPTRLNEIELGKLTVSGSQRWAETDHWVYGAGAVCRKSILMNIINKGWRQIATGRTGANQLSGEDVEICFMIYLSGYKITADDRLTFQHFIPLKRQTYATILGMSFWLSYSYYLMYSYLVILNKETKSLNRVSFDLWKRHSKLLIKGVFVLILQKLNTWSSPSIEQKETVLRNYGMVCSIIKNRKKVIRHHQHILDILKISNEQ
jgi:hypothetical protein